MGHIVLSGIEKSFGATAVLKGIDLEIRAGEFLTLVGPSGCGKSTLLRIVAGLEAQTAGDVSIEGRNVNGVRPSDRDLAMVFQSYALYPHLTVRKNMLTPLRLRDLTAWQRLPLVGRFLPGTAAKLAAMQQTVAEVAEVLKIEPLLARKPGQLSGGQRQRAALGRAMVRRPVAFLMDEPLSNLDAALRVHMRTELTELHRRLGATFIYVTHDQAEALTMSSRVAVMMDGELLQLDTPSRVYAAPADLRVAAFVGSPRINLLSGSLDAAGRVSLLGRTLRRAASAPPQAVTVGLRPEHLAVVSQGAAVSQGAVVPEGEAGETFAGTVRHLSYLGSDVFLHAALADGREELVVRCDPEATESLSPGDAVAIAQARGAALVFGADGARIPLGEAADAALEVA